MKRKIFSFRKEESIMLDLLKDYSVQDIFIFIVLLALSLKGCVSFFDWIGKRLHRAIDKAEKPDRL